MENHTQDDYGKSPRFNYYVPGDRGTSGTDVSHQAFSKDVNGLRSGYSTSRAPQFTRNYVIQATRNYGNISTNVMLPPLGIGESNCHDKSGLALGSCAISSAVQAVGENLASRSSRFLSAGMPAPLQCSSGLLSAGKYYPADIGHGRRSTGLGQTADFTVKNELPLASTAVTRDSLKRKLNFPTWASIQCQRRKIMPQSSVRQSSPDLQNALGHIATTGHSMPASTTLMNAYIPSAVERIMNANYHTRNATYLSSEAKTAGAYNTARVTPYFTTSAATRNFSAEVALDIPSSMTSSVAAPTYASPPMDARVPITSTNSQRVAAAALSSSRRSAAALPAFRKAHLLQTNSNMTRPSLTDWKKSLPALADLAKEAPGFRASQVPSSMAHIKFQGFDLPTAGFKCMLCKSDLSLAPEGPIPPTVTTLHCGHTFHDYCLQAFTPEDQSEDPPCIPCTMGET